MIQRKIFGFIWRRKLLTVLITLPILAAIFISYNYTVVEQSIFPGSALSAKLLELNPFSTSLSLKTVPINNLLGRYAQFSAIAQNKILELQSQYQNTEWAQCLYGTKSDTKWIIDILSGDMIKNEFMNSDVFCDNISRINDSILIGSIHSHPQNNSAQMSYADIARATQDYYSVSSAEIACIYYSNNIYCYAYPYTILRGSSGASSFTGVDIEVDPVWIVDKTLYYTALQTDGLINQTNQTANINKLGFNVTSELLLLFTSFSYLENYYNITNTSNLFYNKSATDDRYFNRTDLDAGYYNKSLSDNRYYNKSDSDVKQYNKTESDSRYYNKTDADNKYLVNTGDTINGNLLINGNFSVIGSITNYTVNQSIINGSILPVINGTFNIGAPLFYWSRLYGKINSTDILEPLWLTTASESSLNVNSATFAYGLNNNSTLTNSHLHNWLNITNTPAFSLYDTSNDTNCNVTGSCPTIVYVGDANKVTSTIANITDISNANVNFSTSCAGLKDNSTLNNAILLNAGNISAGTLVDARLSTNVPLINVQNVWTGLWNYFVNINVSTTNTTNLRANRIDVNGGGINASSMNITAINTTTLNVTTMKVGGALFYYNGTSLIINVT